MNQNIKAIETLRNVLNENVENKKRISIKEMIYNNEYENYEEEQPFENEPENSSEEEMLTQNQVQIEQSDDPEIIDILSNIRLAVINGLAKLANKPNSVSYETLKKILQIVDKPIEAVNKH